MIKTWGDRLAEFEDGAIITCYHTTGAMQDEIDDLRTKLAELEADAARYRWLRNTKTIEDWIYWIWDAISYTKSNGHAAYCKGLDAAVDAAMKGTPS